MGGVDGGVGVEERRGAGYQLSLLLAGLLLARLSLPLLVGGEEVLHGVVVELVGPFSFYLWLEDETETRCGKKKKIAGSDRDPMTHFAWLWPGECYMWASVYC